jgi:hypothetical protein
MQQLSRGMDKPEIVVQEATFDEHTLTQVNLLVQPQSQTIHKNFGDELAGESEKLASNPSMRPPHLTSTVMPTELH